MAVRFETDHVNLFVLVGWWLNLSYGSWAVVHAFQNPMLENVVDSDVKHMFEASAVQKHTYMCV